MSSGNHQLTAEALTADLLAGAKLILLTEDGTLEERLTSAWTTMAVHALPLASQLPPVLCAKVTGITETLVGHAAGEGDDLQEELRAAIAAMTREQHIRAAIEVSELCDDLDREVRANQAALGFHR